MGTPRAQAAIYFIANSSLTVEVVQMWRQLMLLCNFSDLRVFHLKHWRNKLPIERKKRAAEWTVSPWEENKHLLQSDFVDGQRSPHRLLQPRDALVQLKSRCDSSTARIGVFVLSS